MNSPAITDSAQCLFGFSGYHLVDSLAVEASGNVCAATIINGGISVVAPHGAEVDFIGTGDPLTTNLCFGGDELKTAYITAAGTGRLLRMEWPRAGAKLRYLNY